MEENETYNGYVVETAILIGVKLYNELGDGWSFGDKCNLIKQLATEFEDSLGEYMYDEVYLDKLDKFIEQKREDIKNDVL